MSPLLQNLSIFICQKACIPKFLANALQEATQDSWHREVETEDKNFMFVFFMNKLENF